MSRYGKLKRPTVAGWYWYRQSPNYNWRCVEIYWDEEFRCLMISAGVDDVNLIENYQGEYFGPIPEPDNKEME